MANMLVSGRSGLICLGRGYIQESLFGVDKNYVNITRTNFMRFVFSSKSIPNNNFNVGSTLLLGWYNVVTSHDVKSTLKQRCVRQHWSLQPSTTLKEHCVFQRWIEQRYTTLKQGCHFKRGFSRRWATSKKRCKYDHLKKN